MGSTVRNIIRNTVRNMVRNTKLFTGIFFALAAVVSAVILFSNNTAAASTQNDVYGNGTEASEETGYAQKVVRVAYVVSGNFQSGGEGERKSGYGYEYLQKISYYTGWKYEYVYGSFSESLERLKNGEVDLMSNVSYTPERAEYIDYSAGEQGEEYFYIYGYDGICDIDASDISDFNGRKIGITAGSYQIELLNEWCQENNIDCEIIEYDNLSDRISDFENGVTDATVATGGYPGENWMPLVMIGRALYYYGVNKERPDILEELDEAMSAIKLENPYYNEELGAKYLTSSSALVKRLSAAEQEWLKIRENIRVGYLNGYMPYCGTDDEGNVDGVLESILDNFSKEYDIDFTVTAFSSYTDMKNALSEGQVDTIFPAFGDYGIAEDRDEMVSDAVITSSMMVFNRGEELKDTNTIAICYSDPFQEQYAAIYFPDAEIVECKNLTECVEAVMDKKADFTIVESAKVNESENVIRNKKIQKVELPGTINISFAVNTGNIQLLSILDKCIIATDDSLIINSLIFHSQENVQYTIIDFFREHIVTSFAFIFIIFAIIIGILIMHYKSVLKSRKEMSEAYFQIKTAKWKAAHDALTGLYNRATFEEICESYKNVSTELALLIVDVDKFKDINDTHGHWVGDKALVKVANLLTKFFRTGDYVIRYAGDEFVIIMVNIYPNDADMISERIDNINKELGEPSDDVPGLSISVGVAFSEDGYSKELFNRADKALYSVKDNGRNGCAFSSSM